MLHGVSAEALFKDIFQIVDSSFLEFVAGIPALYLKYGKRKGFRLLGFIGPKDNSVRVPDA